MPVQARRSKFGALSDGREVDVVELSNANGITVRIITLGATIQSLLVPDKHGKTADVVLGYATAQEYLAKPQYFGVTVGRYANRIARGKFTLDDTQYTLTVNDGPNHLHGGLRGFDTALWTIESLRRGESNGSVASVVLAYTSVDGEQGYPGTLKVTATYSLNHDNELRIDYEARTDRPTVLNITNHAYYNLAGEASGRDVLDHRLMVKADAFTPVDPTLIPTGERRPVADSAFDFRIPARIGERIRDGRDEQLRFARGYDHNFVLNRVAAGLQLAARLEESTSGRIMELSTTAPGLQFYSGNFLDATSVGKSGHVYRQGDGLCLEPQAFPDSPNQPQFPSTRLDPSDIYRHSIGVRFSLAT